MKKNKLPFSRKSAFKVPENYFETLEARVMENIDSFSSQETIQKGQNPYKIPKNYFEEFDEKLFEKLEKEKKQSKIISLFNRESYYYIAATAAVFVAIVTTVFFNDPEPKFGGLNMVALENYIDESMEFSTSDVTELFQNDSILPDVSPNNNFDEEAILDYLNENVEETAIIFNEN